MDTSRAGFYHALTLFPTLPFALFRFGHVGSGNQFWIEANIQVTRPAMRSHHSTEGLATGGFHFRWQRDSWAGAEPRNEVPLGANGTLRQEGNAVPERRALRGECGGREGDFVRQMNQTKSGKR